MSTWDIAWRIALFAVVAVVCLALVVQTEKRAAEKFDTDWRNR